MIGSANRSCENTSGGVTTAATANEATIIYFLNLTSFSVVVTPALHKATTATGTSKATPKAMNICRTKDIYEFISGANEIVSGEKEDIKLNTMPNTTK